MKAMEPLHLMQISGNLAQSVTISLHCFGNGLALLQQFADRRILDRFKRATAGNAAREQPVAHPGFEAVLRWSILRRELPSPHPAEFGLGTLQLLLFIDNLRRILVQTVAAFGPDFVKWAILS